MEFDDKMVCAEKARFITGAALTVDGGSSIGTYGAGTPGTPTGIATS
jgi:hypothetical protein